MTPLVVEKERLEQQVVQYQNEILRASDVNAVAEKDHVRLTNDNLAVANDLANAQKEIDAFKDVVSHHEMWAREFSRIADAPDPNMMPVVAQLNT